MRVRQSKEVVYCCTSSKTLKHTCLREASQRSHWVFQLQLRGTCFNVPRDGTRRNQLHLGYRILRDMRYKQGAREPSVILAAYAALSRGCCFQGAEWVSEVSGRSTTSMCAMKSRVDTHS